MKYGFKEVCQGNDMKERLIAFVIAMPLVDCSGAKERAVGIPDSVNTLRDVRLDYLAGDDDLFRSKKALVLKIFNQSTNKLANCVVTIDA